MREIHVEEIRDNVAQICIDAAYNLSEDVLTAFDRAEETETAPAAREIIGLLKENARIAREERIPICQDTGIAIFFVEIGQDLRIKDIALLVRKTVGFNGEIQRDLSKPDGTPKKLLDVSRMKSLGWEAKTSLEDGIIKTYESYAGAMQVL